VQPRNRVKPVNRKRQAHQSLQQQEQQQVRLPLPVEVGASSALLLGTAETKSGSAHWTLAGLLSLPKWRMAPAGLVSRTLGVVATLKVLTIAEWLSWYMSCCDCIALVII
jgi:hypothetical protein